MATKVINGKAKGSRFENEVKKDFARWTGSKWERTFRSGGGEQKGDIAPVDLPQNFIVEIKFRQSWNPGQLLLGIGPFFDWWLKLKGECLESQFPLLVLRRNHFSRLVALDSRGAALVESVCQPLCVLQGALIEPIYIFLYDEFIEKVDGKRFMQV